MWALRSWRFKSSLRHSEIKGMQGYSGECLDNATTSPIHPPGLLPACERRIQPGCGSFFEFQRNVTVDVQRNGYATMPQHRLYCLGGLPQL